MPKVYIGDDVHITLNDVVVAVLSKTAIDEDIPALPIQLTNAKSRWGELLSAVSTIGAQFVFLNKKDPNKRVYLYRASEYRNDFAEKWSINLSHSVSASINDRKSDKSAKEMMEIIIKLLHRSNVLTMATDLSRYTANNLEHYEVD